MECYYNRKHIENANPDRILITGKGMTYSIPLKKSSKYDGMFIFSTENRIRAVKLLDSIDLDGIRALERIDYTEGSAVLHYSDGLIARYRVKTHNAELGESKKNTVLVVDYNKPVSGAILFDVRYAYDNEPFDKRYDVSEKNISRLKKSRFCKEKLLTINYEKKNRDSAFSKYDLKQKCELLLQSNNDAMKCELQDHWVKKINELNLERKDFPFEAYYYSPISFHNVTRIIISEKNPSAFSVAYNLDFIEPASQKLLTAQDTLKENLLRKGLMLNNELSSSEDKKDFYQRSKSDAISALHASVCQLKAAKLCTNKKGSVRECDFVAGFPWFYQNWARDSAISAKSLQILGDDTALKTLLLSLLESLLKSESSIKEESSIRSADALPVTFHRIKQSLYLFTDTEKSIIKRKLLKYLKALEGSYVKEELLYNEGLETWMDTGDNFREGFNVEINALYLSMLELAVILEETEHKKGDLYQSLSNAKAGIRTAFFDFESGVLYDNLDLQKNRSRHITNSIFLAYYFYSELLYPEEWERAFDHALSVLTSESAPGLLSSISKNSHLYKKNHSGVNNESYHRGDSWYFVNNIAAMAMGAVNKEKYDAIIGEIYGASVDDCIRLGAFCYSSEISSATRQESKGCWAQTWSASTFLELCGALGLYE